MLLKASLLYWRRRVNRGSFQESKFVPDFSTIFTTRDELCKAHIHAIALGEGLSTQHFEKNNLSDLELRLFYRKLLEFGSSVENGTQHYVAWVLAYKTGVRPGPLPIAKGTAKAIQLATWASSGVRKMRRCDERTSSSSASSKVLVQLLSLASSKNTATPTLKSKSWANASSLFQDRISTLSLSSILDLPF